MITKRKKDPNLKNKLIVKIYKLIKKLKQQII